MAKDLIVGKTRTNQPVSMTQEFFSAIRGVANYAMEHGEDVDASLKSVTTVGGANVGGALAVTGNASVGGNLTVTGSINGETNPSLKPIYYHPVVIWGQENGDYEGDSISIVALTNNSTNFSTIQSFIDWIETYHITYLAPASGSVWYNNKRYIISWIDVSWSGSTFSGLNIRCQGVDTNVYLEQVMISKNVLLESFRIGDNANKIN